MSNRPTQNSTTSSSEKQPDEKQPDEKQFERLLRLVAALQASSPDASPEETLVHQSPRHGSPIVMKMDSLRREIELRAYQIYLQRGGTHGWDMDDWLQAEMELRERLGLGRDKAIMRLALAWGLPKAPTEGLSASR